MAETRWRSCGSALTAAMAEVLEELPEDVRGHALETADYWLSVGARGAPEPGEGVRARG